MDFKQLASEWNHEWLIKWLIETSRMQDAGLLNSNGAEKLAHYGISSYNQQQRLIDAL